MNTVKGVAEVQPSVAEKLVRVKYDPDLTSVKDLVKTINTKTRYHAREPEPSGKPDAGKR